MDFGLGLILSFTDNATAGINNAVNSLNQLTQIAEGASSSLNQMASLSALSVVSDRLGSSFLSAGGAILSTFGKIIGEVNTTGQTLFFAERQLDALYRKSGKTGKEVIAQIQDYAETSMFEFENLIPAVTQLKSVGIEAFDAITSSTGDSTHSLLDYASALASFAPQMKNAYGTGINAAIGAMREYIAEGNALSLKRGAGLDITGILGEDKGATIEDRTRQVADLIETLGMLEMVDTMKDSPMVKLSNMGDVLFKFKGMVSSSGVYDAINGLIDIFADFVMGIPDERLQSIAKTVGSALSSLIKPIEWLSKKIVALADSFLTFVENNPEMAKFVTIGIALAGVFLLLSGVALKITSAFSGVSLMLLACGKTFSSFSSLFSLGIKGILTKLGPLALAIGLVYLAWKSDFGGLRSLITSFASKFITTVGLIIDAWDFTLSEENFQKAKELGVLPLIEAILDLKYRFGFFKEGFIAGWKQISDNISNALKGLSSSLEGTAFEGLVEGLTTFLEKLSSGDTQAWYEFGESFGKFVAKAIAFRVAMKSLSAVFKILNPIINTTINTLRTLSNVLSRASVHIGDMFNVLKNGRAGVTTIGKLAEVFKAVSTGAMGLKDAMTVVFGGITTVVTGIVSFVAGSFMAVLGFVKQLVDGFSWFWEIIKWIGLALAAVGAVLLGICGGWVAALVAAIVGIVTTAIVLIKDNWAKISEFFSNVGSWFYNNVIQPVANFFVNLWNGIVNGVITAVNGIKNFFSTIASWIYSNVIQPIVNFFMTYIYPFIAKIIEIVAKIIEIVVVLIGVAIQQICTVIGNIVSWINTNIIQPIANFFVWLWNGIVAGVTAFVSAVCSVFSTIASWVNANVIQPIANFFAWLWNGISAGVQAFIGVFVSLFQGAVTNIQNFFNSLVTFFQTIWNTIVSIFTTIGTAVGNAISGAVKGAVNALLGGAAKIINGFISAINFAIGVINAIPGVSISTIAPLSVPQLAQGGVVDNPTMALIGEAGTEAVMPLENNTEWIGKLAGMISSEMKGIQPMYSDSRELSPSTNNGSQEYLTNNNSTSQTIQGDTDNSVVFQSGAIQVNVQNASEEEAIRLANKVMMYIKRQKELEMMTQYA